jgi:hypothetical protein
MSQWRLVSFVIEEADSNKHDNDNNGFYLCLLLASQDAGPKLTSFSSSFSCLFRLSSSESSVSLEDSELEPDELDSDFGGIPILLTGSSGIFANLNRQKLNDTKTSGTETGNFGLLHFEDVL